MALVVFDGLVARFFLAPQPEARRSAPRPSLPDSRGAFWDSGTAVTVLG
jgi:hypothetical protein